jgi:hypothetical protein
MMIFLNEQSLYDLSIDGTRFSTLYNIMHGCPEPGAQQQQQPAKGGAVPNHPLSKLAAGSTTQAQSGGSGNFYDFDLKAGSGQTTAPQKSPFVRLLADHRML